MKTKYYFRDMKDSDLLLYRVDSLGIFYQNRRFWKEVIEVIDWSVSADFKSEDDFYQYPEFSKEMREVLEEELVLLL